jgi:hypothetical protein
MSPCSTPFHNDCILFAPLLCTFIFFAYLAWKNTAWRGSKHTHTQKHATSRNSTRLAVSMETFFRNLHLFIPGSFNEENSALFCIMAMMIRPKQTFRCCFLFLSLLDLCGLVMAGEILTRKRSASRGTVDLTHSLVQGSSRDEEEVSRFVVATIFSPPRLAQKHSYCTIVALLLSL